MKTTEGKREITSPNLYFFCLNDDKDIVQKSQSDCLSRRSATPVNGYILRNSSITISELRHLPDAIGLALKGVPLAHHAAAAHHAHHAAAFDYGQAAAAAAAMAGGVPYSIDGILSMTPAGLTAVD
ncbi:hypothetical protein CEXT_101471 [Caerostris extrusa]|uniref:Uncharacterized protein n=1 Tax=Caerostris extrusa TaxID=172846 RepID=A0AAV4TDX8_CAEEX|nr:hypothetical protein CEXT_101471 [Caerostris extrusa]